MANQKTSRKRKKAKRGITSARGSRSYSQLYRDNTTVPEQVSSNSPSATIAVAESTLKGSDVVSWRQEYAHVMDDLNRLLIVSVILFALIIGASFFV